MNLKFIFFLSITSILFFTCQPKETKKTTERKNNKLKIETYKVKQGWGYKILYNEKIFIEQEHIPCISGKFSFETEEDAYKTAYLVCEKIFRQELPPSVTKNELDSMNIKLPDE